MKHWLIIMLAFSYCYAGLIRPGNGEELHYLHVLFEWDQEPNAQSYNLQVSETESFTDIIVDIINETTVYIETETISWENTYYWRVRPIYNDSSYGVWSEVSNFTTGASIFQNFNTTTFDGELVEDGLIVFGQMNPYGNNAGVVDQNGNEVWHMEDIFFSSANEYGQLFGGFLAPPYIAREFNFESDTVWHTPIGGGLDNHEFFQLPNGNYMTFINVYEMGPIHRGSWTQSFQNAGYLADGITNEFPWRGHRIVEFDKDTKEQVWDWNAFDHFSMDDYDAYGGTWNYALHKNWYDWLHGNAFYFDAEESVIYVSFRSLSRITKIAYPSGDVIWNMGLPERYGTGDDNICTDLLFSFQHHIQLLENGDLLFFDNGNLSEMLLGDPYPVTRIRRIRVVDDSECGTVWQYDLPLHLYAHAVGSVQYLDNGNYFINTMATGRGSNDFSNLEITPEQVVVWELTADVNTTWYRSFKIPSLHPEAFSVMLDQYRKVKLSNEVVDGVILDDTYPSLTFTIYNESSYSQPYIYSLIDSLGWFSESRDTIILNANEQITISFEPAVQSDSVSSLTLHVWPEYHDYAMKSFNYIMYNLLTSNEEHINAKFTLMNNFPNPFNPITTLRYDLPENSFVNVTIYDMLGREVKRLVNGEQASGYYQIVWDGTDNYGEKVSAGVYLYRIQASDFVQTKKMVLLK